MSRIRILSEQMANQIAAGEVVERPASVVKELVENSLDAGATRIDIHVEGGGTGLLRVADNGCGMDGDDVLLCLERHATSKLRDEAGLLAIATLGFRGEAIPSIGSVAHLIILSRLTDQPMGTRAEVRYGVLREVREEGCARGTVMEVRHLFGNMPARKKFLKSVRTELHHIEEVIKNQALAHPATGFTLTIDGKVVLEYGSGANLEQRVREVFRVPPPFLALAGETAAAGEACDDSADSTAALALEGFLLLPEQAPATTARLRLLVNGRPVQDGMLRHAVAEGLHGFLMKGYQPSGVLLLTVAPDQVDVNVHPAKREIRFRRSEPVHRFVVEQVRRALASRQQQLRTSLFTSEPAAAWPLPAAAAEALPPLPREPEWHGRTEPAWLTTAEPRPAFPDPLPWPPDPAPTSASYPDGPGLPQEPPEALFPPADLFLEPVGPSGPMGATQAAGSAGESAAEFAGLTVIGQLFALYLLCEKDGHLVVIDQHAAHERLLYGQLRQGYLASDIPRQHLMFPVTVELSPSQLDTLETRLEEVAALGFAVEPFGDATWVIKAAPALVSQVEPAGLLREILDGLRGAPRQQTDRPVPQVVDDLLASMACKAAIKAGNQLQPREMLGLLAQMEGSAVFSHCPHGRPVVKTFSAQEVERWFHRHGG